MDILIHSKSGYFNWKQMIIFTLNGERNANIKAGHHPANQAMQSSKFMPCKDQFIIFQKKERKIVPLHKWNGTWTKGACGNFLTLLLLLFFGLTFALIFFLFHFKWKSIASKDIHAFNADVNVQIRLHTTKWNWTMHHWP